MSRFFGCWTKLRSRASQEHDLPLPTQEKNIGEISELATNSLISNDSASGFKMESDLYSTTGKGICIIFANFSPENSHGDNPALLGYKHDIHSLVQLFRDDKLDFDVRTRVKDDMPFRNLSTRQFRTCLADLQNFLNHNDTKYDKFVMFVLSHGREKGICMCEENSDGRRFEEENGEQCVISQEEIIHSFTHDVVPSLEGVPKCFFFQACRGEGYTQAAAAKGSHIVDDNTTTQLLPSIVSKDILVVHASLDSKQCYVNSMKGSWFIQTLTKTLQQQCEFKDIYGIVSNVIEKISKCKETEFVYCNRKDCEMKTKVNGKEFTVSVVGRLNDQEYRPLCVPDKNYSFVSAEPLNLSLCEFKGKISYLPIPQGEIPFTEWEPAETLKIFGNSKHFEITGQLRNKAKVYKHQKIKIQGDIAEIAYSDIPDCDMAKVDIMAKLKHEDLEQVVEPSSLEKCFIFMDGKKYGSGQFTQSNGLWGMNVEIYQLPVFTSTLTKQLYLAKLNKVQHPKETVSRYVAEQRFNAAVTAIAPTMVKLLADNFLSEPGTQLTDAEASTSEAASGPQKRK